MEGQSYSLEFSNCARTAIFGKWRKIDLEIEGGNRYMTSRSLKVAALVVSRSGLLQRYREDLLKLYACLRIRATVG